MENEIANKLNDLHSTIKEDSGKIVDSFLEALQVVTDEHLELMLFAIRQEISKRGEN